MTPLVVIPTRMASTRLPGKPLVDIHGQPMIVHVWRRAKKAAVGPVVVACAEPSIAAAVQAVGGTAVLTRQDHPSGSDRVFEAVQAIDPAGFHDVIVNVQGDLPAFESQILTSALAALTAQTMDMDIVTLVAPLTDSRAATDPNVVKAVVGFDSTAGAGAIARVLYFSRAIVPSGPGPLFHHVGLYVYRRVALTQFIAWQPSVLETRERLEQLRALENGLRIAAVLIDSAPLGVDTQNDLARVRGMLSPTTKAASEADSCPEGCSREKRASE
ncbi:3-deoxy-manno-octulosonate cytidylyltransferase [invertebrate metagenome]|uniref:3-deoxy-manno-octulosonate cytidylyltransferase n=1 Tax=invertebrate metagenome TaxID=1711999 RepID=A0A484H6U4_9ZZZZ